MIIIAAAPAIVDRILNYSFLGKVLIVNLKILKQFEIKSLIYFKLCEGLIQISHNVE